MNVARKLERLAGLLSRHAKALEQAVHAYRRHAREVSYDDLATAHELRMSRAASMSHPNPPCIGCGGVIPKPPESNAPMGFCCIECARRAVRGGRP